MKRILTFLLILSMLIPHTVSAREQGDTANVITQAQYDLVEEMWQEIVKNEEKATRASSATAKAVASAVCGHSLYMPGTLRWNGEDHFTFRTTVGVTCGYSTRLRNIARDAGLSDEVSEPETQVISYGKKSGPYSRDVYLIEPYYQIDDSFTKQYQTEANAIAEATGGTYHLYTQTAATVDVVAQAIENGGVVIFDSHGDTDFAKGDDYTSGATTSYLLLQTGTGLTDEDYADDNGTYHAIYYGSYGSMKYYAVDGTCIANHMGAEAPNSLLWMAICLGMATDGLQKPLRENGVEVVYGYSQSVTFDYDYLWEEIFFDELRANKTVAEAIAKMKEDVGQWDCCDYYTNISVARNYDCAFPVVVSSQDEYPGHGNVDALQTVCSTWTMYYCEPCLHESVMQNEIAPTCEADGSMQTLCADCGEILSAEPIPALGHNLVTQTVAPTCTESGTVTVFCDRCYMVSSIETMEATGHSYEMELIEPTCETEGGELYCCTLCGDSYLDNTVAKLEHEFVDEVCIHCGRACWCELYSDVDPASWFHNAVVYAYCNELMNGVSDGLFDPEGELTRAMLVTILYRVSGSPEIGSELNPFADVPADQWYSQAVIWAYSEGIVYGISATEFAPNASITREQIATILYRLAGSPVPTVLTTGFCDADEVSDYAADAVLWAVELGIINGMDGLLAPQKTATRAQAAALLMRYMMITT